MVESVSYRNIKALQNIFLSSVHLIFYVAGWTAIRWHFYLCSFNTIAPLLHAILSKTIIQRLSKIEIKAYFCAVL